VTHAPATELRADPTREAQRHMGSFIRAFTHNPEVTLDLLAKVLAEAPGVDWANPLPFAATPESTSPMSSLPASPLNPLPSHHAFSPLPPHYAMPAHYPAPAPAPAHYAPPSAPAHYAPPPAPVQYPPPGGYATPAAPCPFPAAAISTAAAYAHALVPAAADAAPPIMKRAVVSTAVPVGQPSFVGPNPKLVTCSGPRM